MVWKLLWLNCIPTLTTEVIDSFSCLLLVLNCFIGMTGIGGGESSACLWLSCKIVFRQNPKRSSFLMGEGKLKCCRQETERSIQKMFALWCFPACFSQASSAHLSCGEQHTMLLCPDTTQQLIMEAKTPWPQLPVPKYCPLLSTHTLSPALVAQPEATASEAREGTDLYRVSRTWKHTHTHTNTLNLHEDEHTPSY